VAPWDGLEGRKTTSPPGFFCFCKTVSLLVRIRYRVNRFAYVPNWSLCGIFYIISTPAVMSPWGNGRCYCPRCMVPFDPGPSSL